jgi:hypothetical protein
MALPEGHCGVSSTTSSTEYSSLSTNTDVDEDMTSSSVELSTPESRSTTPPTHRPTPRLHPSQGGPERIPLSAHERLHSSTPLLHSPSPIQIPLPLTALIDPPRLDPEYAHRMPELPTALHANFLTSCIGLATGIILWWPLVLFHYLGWETFTWPGTAGGSVWEIWCALGVVSWGGAIYVSQHSFNNLAT